jgi:hypothetical protein
MRVRFLIVGFLVGCGAFGLAPSVGAFVYWTSLNDNQTIGRATLAGSAADSNFITGARHPCGVAVDSTHLYWANSSGSRGGGPTPGATIGRSNLDGSGVNPSFIAGPYYPCGVAVDSAHVYWANSGVEGVFGQMTGTTIGRANLDGTAPNQSFITGANGPCGVAVDSGHVYWANRVGDSIGRANLDGTGANPNFITGADGPCGVAVDSGHVYWANANYSTASSGGYDGTTIGRANLDGTAPNQSFITTGPGNGPFGVAVDSRHLYWADFRTPYGLGRANLDGSAVDPNFIADKGNLTGVAVNADPATLFTLDATRIDPSRGMAILTITMVGPGKVAVSGKDVKRATEVAGKGKLTSTLVKIAVKPTAEAKRRLNEAGKLKVKVKIAYTPTGGSPETQQLKLTLKKR